MTQLSGRGGRAVDAKSCARDRYGSAISEPTAWKWESMVGPWRGGSVNEMSGWVDDALGSSWCLERWSRAIWIYVESGDGKETCLKICECKLRDRSCTPTSFLFAEDSVSRIHGCSAVTYHATLYFQTLCLSSSWPNAAHWMVVSASVPEHGPEKWNEKSIDEELCGKRRSVCAFVHKVDTLKQIPAGLRQQCFCLRISANVDLKWT